MTEDCYLLPPSCANLFRASTSSVAMVSNKGNNSVGNGSSPLVVEASHLSVVNAPHFLFSASSGPAGFGPSSASNNNSTVQPSASSATTPNLCSVGKVVHSLSPMCTSFPQPQQSDASFALPAAAYPAVHQLASARISQEQQDVYATDAMPLPSQPFMDASESKVVFAQTGPIGGGASKTKYAVCSSANGNGSGNASHLANNSRCNAGFYGLSDVVLTRVALPVNATQSDFYSESDTVLSVSGSDTTSSNGSSGVGSGNASQRTGQNNRPSLPLNNGRIIQRHNQRSNVLFGGVSIHPLPCHQQLQFVPNESSSKERVNGYASLNVHSAMHNFNDYRKQANGLPKSVCLVGGSENCDGNKAESVVEGLPLSTKCHSSESHPASDSGYGGDRVSESLLETSHRSSSNGGLTLQAGFSSCPNDLDSVSGSTVNASLGGSSGSSSNNGGALANRGTPSLHRLHNHSQSDFSSVGGGASDGASLCASGSGGNLSISFALASSAEESSGNNSNAAAHSFHHASANVVTSINPAFAANSNGSSSAYHGPIILTTVASQANLLRFTPSPFRELLHQQQQQQTCAVGGNGGCGVPSISCGGHLSLAGLHAQQLYGSDASALPLLNSNQHVVFVHVNLGETLSVRVGNEIQHIPGPATVRMVSQNSGSPGPLPLHVPPGHVVQQILDEQGALRHLILSPEQPPVSGAMISNPYLTLPNCPPNPSSFSNAPLMPSSSANLPSTPMPAPSFPMLAPNISLAAPPSGSGIPPAMPVGLMLPKAMEQQPPHRPSPIYGGSVLTAGHPNVLRPDMPSSLHFCQETLMYPVDVRQSVTNQRSKGASRNAPAHNATKGFYVPEDVDQCEYLELHSEAVHGEEQAKLIELLSKIQPPQVTEVSTFDALIQWQRIDCSDASCGPFPEIEASDFIYEILVAERRSGGDGKYKIQFRGESTEHRLIDLRPATEYCVKMRAILEPYTGNLTDPVEFCTKACRPDRPSVPKIDKRTKNSIMLKWAQPRQNGASICAYHLESDGGSGEKVFAEVYRGLEKQHLLRKLHPGTTYHIRLAASNEFGKSDYSDTLQVSTAGTAPLTAGRSATLGVGAVFAPRRLAEALWRRRVHSANGRPEYVCNGRELSWICSELRHSQDYRFRLCACNEDGNSPWSDVVTYRTRPARPCPPSKPYNKGRIHASSVKIAWDPPSDTGGSHIQSYLLESSMLTESGNESGWAVVYSGPEREHNCTGLFPGRSYHFRVSCSTEGGRSQFSEVLAVATLPVAPGPCRSPTLVSKPKANSIHVKWVAPDQTGGAEITQYEVRMIPPDGQAQILTTGLRLDCAVAGLLPGRTFQFSVRAHNKAGVGQWSEALFATSAAGPPDSPKDLKCLQKTPFSALISWAEPATNGAAILEYRLCMAIRRPAAACVPSLPDTANDQSDVRAASESLVLEPASGSVVAPIADVCEFANDSSSSSASSSAQGSPEHRLSAHAGGSEKKTAAFVAAFFAEFVQVYAGSAPHFDILSLQPATDYAFKVQAINSVGVSRFSPLLHCQTAAAPPAAVQNVQAETVSTTEASVSWEEPAANGNEILCYHIDLCPCPPSTSLPLSVTAGSLQYLIGDLDPETTYRIRVLAVNGIGAGVWSNAVRATTFSRPPNAPHLECVSAGYNNLRLRWTDDCRSHEPLTYSLEMENKSGSFSPVYEGTARLHKVARLTESTSYRFRIRATSPTGGAGFWSDAFEFTTVRAPPPPVKGVPRVTQTTCSSCQVDWLSVKMPLAQGDKLWYCLQLSSAKSGDDFKTVYQGALTSFLIKDLSAATAYRIRVCLVRLSPPSASDNAVAQVVETFGPFCAPVMFSTPALETANADDTLANDASDSDGHATRAPWFPSPLSVIRGEAELTDRQLAAVAMVLFGGVAFIVAFVVQMLIQY